MNSENRPLILLHTAVFLAGWTGIFGRLITLSGLPLVWYRIMVSVVVLALVLALMKRLHRTGWKAIAMIAGCGAILAVHWVAFFATMLLYELIGGVLFLTLLMPFYTHLMPAESIALTLKDGLWLLLLGSVFTVLPFLFQLQALRSLSAFTVNLAYNLEPIYNIAIAAILFGELREVNFSFWLGIALIIISVLIQTRHRGHPMSDCQ